MKPIKSLNYSSLEVTKSVLEAAIAPHNPSHLIVLQSFDPSKHIAKYRITFKNGSTEIASSESEFMDIIEECLDSSWVYQWAADGLEQDHPSEEDVRFYTLDNAHMCLTDYGCSIDKFFEGEVK